MIIAGTFSAWLWQGFLLALSGRTFGHDRAKWASNKRERKKKRRNRENMKKKTSKRPFFSSATLVVDVT